MKTFMTKKDFEHLQENYDKNYVEDFINKIKLIHKLDNIDFKEDELSAILTFFS